MSSWHYTREHGSYYLKDEKDRIQWMGQAIAVLLDTDTMTLLKHGSPETVEAYVAKSRQQAIDGGFEDLVRSWTSVTSENWDLVLLNRCLSTVGAVAELCKQLKIEA